MGRQVAASAYDILQIHVDKVIEGIDMLFDETFDCQEGW
jgi:hypothetical protein